MTILDKDTAGSSVATEESADHGDQPLYTRYCVAPRPVHPVGEPRIVHTMLLATWLGRLIDPLPHKADGRHGPGSKPAG